MVSYKDLNVGDPLAKVFSDRGLNWIAGIIAVSAVFATASVLLVFQMGQPRIWMSMSRDGLLPKIFSRIHPVYKTPYFSTILTGFVVAIPALFLNLDVVLALTSIGTLFAFVLVCAGILVLDSRSVKAESKFKVPYVNAKYIVPVAFVTAVLFIAVKFPGYYKSILSEQGFPMIVFFIETAIVSVLSFLKNFSLIPVLGLLSCFYLMAQESHTNWYRFIIWLAIGLIFYFLYGRQNSHLAKKSHS
jgi:amino acid transporter